MAVLISLKHDSLISSSPEDSGLNYSHFPGEQPEGLEQVPIEPENQDAKPKVRFILLRIPPLCKVPASDLISKFSIPI